ncbi:MAG TPA: PEGA domain-containing protein, partial [Sorangium sp.]|nr:PEGA domain-containing protein [Sorangium sp.]
MKDHVRRGQRARNARRWTEAQAAYRAAFEAADPATSTERERAEIAGELGLCELALHQHRDAAEHLARSLEQREALPEALQRRFEQGQREAAKRVARLVLGVDPPDAEVLVDGQRIGRTARTYTLFFEPGKHMVRGRAPGHEDGLHSFLAVAGAEHEITMKLPRAAVSSSAQATAPASPK